MAIRTSGDYGNKLSDYEGDDLESEKGSNIYGLVGNGFSPTTPIQSTKRLKANVYEIQVVQRQLCFVPHNIETDSLIKADRGPAIDVIKEIERFWKLRAEFKKHGFLHKRGFLLYGPPGTGKTSTLNQIMDDTIQKDGLVVLAPVGPPSALIGMLRSLREIEPERNVLVVMEDLDNLIRYGETELLSLLDGEHAIDNVVFLATTNYIERLPPRVVNRPSRFDKQILISGPDAEMRRKYLVSRHMEGAVLEAFITASHGLSMAHLKELIISVAILGNPLDGEVKRLKGAVKGKVEVVAEDSAPS